MHIFRYAPHNCCTVTCGIIPDGSTILCNNFFIDRLLFPILFYLYKNTVYGYLKSCTKIKSRYNKVLWQWFIYCLFAQNPPFFDALQKMELGPLNISPLPACTILNFVSRRGWKIFQEKSLFLVSVASPNRVLQH